MISSSDWANEPAPGSVTVMISFHHLWTIRPLALINHITDGEGRFGRRKTTTRSECPAPVSAPSA